MEQEKIMEAEAPTVWVGATPTGLTAPPPPHPSRFFCPSCRPTNSVKAMKAKYVKMVDEVVLCPFVAGDRQRLMEYEEQVQKLQAKVAFTFI